MSAILCWRKMSLIWLWDRSSHSSAFLLPIYSSIVQPHSLVHQVAIFLMTRTWCFIVTTRQKNKPWCRNSCCCLKAGEYELTLGIGRTPQESYRKQWIKEHPDIYRQKFQATPLVSVWAKALWWCKSSVKFGRMTGSLPGSRRNLPPCNMLALWALPDANHC